MSSGKIIGTFPTRYGRAGRERPVAEAGPTARERELILLIAQGLSNKLIAHEMGISPNTVRAHVGNVMRKYKLRNRTQIAMLLTPMLRSGGPPALRRG